LRVKEGFVDRPLARSVEVIIVTPLRWASVKVSISCSAEGYRRSTT
jgi:hypothetical protein